jgi:mRNA interferase MazF
VVILTRDAALRNLNSITVAPISTVVRGIATEVVLEPVDGVPQTCAITLDNILTVPRAILGRVITSLSQARLTEVFNAIRAAFDMA